MKHRNHIHLLIGISLLTMLSPDSMGQTVLTLDEAIRLAQDSAITAFQSREEYRSRQASYEAFEALRKPQLSLSVIPNYTRIVSDPNRDYVYLRNFDILSAAAGLKLSQKVLPFGGEAFVGTQAVWSEYFRDDAQGYPRQFVATPLLVGYSHSLLGYNPFRWEKLVEDQRLKTARQQHTYNLQRIAEETAVRYFRLVRQQRMMQIREEELRMSDTLYAIANEKATIAMVAVAELRSLEVQRQNAANQLEETRLEEQKATTELLSFLRICQPATAPSASLSSVGGSARASTPSADIPLLPIPVAPPPSSLTPEEAAMLAKANSPAYQQLLTELAEARHQEDKAHKERGVNIGLNVNLGMQQVNTTLGRAYTNQQLYALGSVAVTVPLNDHGAARKRHAAAVAWTERQESALQEVERRLAEDATVTLQKLQKTGAMLDKTLATARLADEVFNMTADNYANGICDMNTYTLALTRRATAYTNYLTTLEAYWTTYYHLQTLIQYE